MKKWTERGDKGWLRCGCEGYTPQIGWWVKAFLSWRCSLYNLNGWKDLARQMPRRRIFQQKKKPVQRFWHRNKLAMSKRSILDKLILSQWSMLHNKVSLPLMGLRDLFILLLVLLVWETWKRLNWTVCFHPLDIISEGSWGWKTHLQNGSSLTVDILMLPGLSLFCMASHPQSLSTWLRLLTAWRSQNTCASYLAIGFQETRVEVASLPKA